MFLGAVVALGGVEIEVEEFQPVTEKDFPRPPAATVQPVSVKIEKVFTWGLGGLTHQERGQVMTIPNALRHLASCQREERAIEVDRRHDFGRAAASGDLTRPAKKARRSNPAFVGGPF